jgi:DNA-binding NarL/FixJ family response regulator
MPDAKVLILSAHSDDAYVETVTALGASGYLVKQTSSHFLSEAIREVRRGRTFFSPAVARRMARRQETTLDRNGFGRTAAVRLTSREIEVLQSIAEGKANKQVAAELDISIKTVEKHRDHLMRKLDIHDTAGLTRYAISSGVIESSVQVTIV